MSGLAGIVRWDGAPVEASDVERLTRGVAHRGLDGISVLTRGAVTMIFAKTVTTPEALFDAQPAVDEQAGLLVVFDGRLDNRDELAAALGNDGSLLDVPDSMLAASAYRQWGSECAVRLLGDFSMVVWDAPKRRLFAARDVMGVRPLYYRADPRAFAWASEMGALATGAANEGYIGEILSHRVTSIDETIHRGVMRLPMAHTLVATAGGTIRRWRYWRPSPGGRIRYRDAREYEEHFRTVFGEAVRARLRLSGGAALLLSGGIDSSSIAAQVARFRSEGLPAAGRVETFSTVVPGHAADEGPVIAAVAERTGLSSTCLSLEEVTEADFATDAAASLDLPAAPDSLQQAAARRGLRVSFSGSGGDEWFFGTDGDLADLLRDGSLLRSARWLRSSQRVPNHKPWPSSLRTAAWMSLPEGVKPAVRCALRRRAVPPWIDDRFAGWIGLEDRLRARPDAVEFDSIGDRYAFWAATRGDAAFHNEQGERASARDGLEERHPYYDRRVIEFALATPPEIRCAGGVPKGLVRRAMSAALPPLVTGMPPEADFGFLTVRWLDSLGGADRISSSRPCRRGWMRPEAVTDMYTAMSSGLTRYMWPIWAAFAVDVWLGTLDTRAEALVEVR